MHTLSPRRETLHGKFSSLLAPALEVESGDRVAFRQTLDVGWGRGQHDRVAQHRDKWGPRESPGDDGMALHGPIYVKGLHPGDTLAVEIQSIRVGSYGWTWSGDGPFNTELNTGLGMPSSQSALLLWELDADAGIAVSESGHRTRLKPFPGTIGLCPGGEGPYECWFPTRTGGNMDCQLLCEGSVLYLPVEVEGGLLSLGDGHAAQGDGELCGSAIECMFEEIVVGIAKSDGLSVDGPTVRLSDGRWAALGFGRSLDDALHEAGRRILDVIERVMDCDRTTALLLSSTFVDLRLTQVVNGVRGIHAVFRPPEQVDVS